MRLTTVIRPIILGILAIAWLCLGTFFGLGFGCVGSGTETISGVNHASPPAPPPELPLLLQIPKELSLNLEKVQAAPAVSFASAAVLKAVVGPNGEFSAEVVGLTESTQFFTEALSGLLDPYHQLLIPVGTNIRTFQGVSVVQGEGQVELVEIKIDFADFDFDGDGVPEGCSGHTAGLPICMRIYADGEPQIAGVFTAFPTSENPGAGRLMGLNVTHAVFLFPKGDFVGINYDLHDLSLGRKIELQVRENPDNPDSGGKSLRFHMLLDQVGEESTSLKTVNINFERNEGELQIVRGVSRWREDQDFWSGTVFRDPPDPDLDNITDQCVDLLTGNGADRNQCLTLGIDVGGLGFVPLPDETTLFLPSDFPASPNF